MTITLDQHCIHVFPPAPQRGGYVYFVRCLSPDRQIKIPASKSEQPVSKTGCETETDETQETAADGVYRRETVCFRVPKDGVEPPTRGFSVPEKACCYAVLRIDEQPVSSRFNRRQQVHPLRDVDAEGDYDERHHEPGGGHAALSAGDGAGCGLNERAATGADDTLPCMQIQSPPTAAVVRRLPIAGRYADELLTRGAVAAGHG